MGVHPSGSVVETPPGDGFIVSYSPGNRTRFGRELGHLGGPPGSSVGGCDLWARRAETVLPAGSTVDDNVTPLAGSETLTTEG